ncbi:protein Tube [Leptopilina boulardi]|uniref:protein Tube n=1 Tax=Leptopilina boulardi TaxID=63433 RepID=UPI0021F68C10|nr:protein Tube [Leptopilina boulardi]
MLPSSSQPVNLNTEIRKLQPLHIYKLAWLLNTVDDDWKKFMFMISMENSDEYKFGMDHLILIEQASRQQKRGCAEIFLEEWSTMGRRRPTLKILLELLKKAQLFRAADYVSMNILNMGRTERPNEGPAARIEIPRLDLDSESDITKNSSIKVDVHVENSNLNKGGNLPVVEEERKVVVPIPAFLEEKSFSNFSEGSINEIPSEIVETESRVITLPGTSQNVKKSQKVNYTGNGEAYKIPAFLENESFGNLSEVVQNVESKMVNDEPREVLNKCEIKPTLPRFLEENFTSTSQDLIAFSSADNLPQNELENCRDVRNKPSSSRINEIVPQLPTFLNEMSLSNFSEVSESEQLSNDKSNNVEGIIKVCKESLSIQNEGVSQLPACLNEVSSSNFSVISEGEKSSFTSGLNSDSIDV